MRLLEHNKQHKIAKEIKNSEKKNFCIIDGGIADIISTAELRYGGAGR